ncbi:MAG: NifB/NifX family molybdenum-iron cluster-binding protein [Sphaerochaeta sp.]|nr:NifB/NifX family molybdenum-iron cluster-binding protein [Sphaerochaeta sp.]
MIIAIPSDKDSLDSAVCVSFGRAPFYCLYDTETEQSTFIVNSAADSPGGAGIKAAQLLVDNKANILVTVRCGENAAKVLQPANIELYKALNLSVADNIAAHKQSKLEPLKEVHAGYHHGH